MLTWRGDVARGPPLEGARGSSSSWPCDTSLRGADGRLQRAVRRLLRDESRKGGKPEVGGSQEGGRKAAGSEKKTPTKRGKPRKKVQKFCTVQKNCSRFLRRCSSFREAFEASGGGRRLQERWGSNLGWPARGQTNRRSPVCTKEGRRLLVVAGGWRRRWRPAVVQGKEEEAGFGADVEGASTTTGVRDFSQRKKAWWRRRRGAEEEEEEEDRSLTGLLPKRA